MSAGQAGYYIDLAREDYYLEGGEPPGIWHGDGAALLGLTGLVQPDQLYNLFDGLSPEGTRALVKFQRKAGSVKHLPGWDLTFNVPKSLSVLWSQASPETRDKISRLHQEAVTIALDYLQDRYGMVRQGQGGKRSVKGGLIFALFEHSTSRALDPHLHIHALLLNVAVAPSGKTGTLTNYRILLAKMTTGALYRAAFASLLMNELGIRIRPTATWWEVEGVSPALVDFESKRAKQIQKEMKRLGTKNPKIAALLAVETRERKKEVSRGNLFDGVWREHGKTFGWRMPAAEATLGKFRPTKSLKAELNSASTKAVETLTATSAHFTEEGFNRAFFEAAQAGAIPPDKLLEHAATYLSSSPEIVRLGVSKKQIRYTTREMFEVESELLRHADQLAKRSNHEVVTKSVIARLSKHPELSAEQMQAVLSLVQRSGDLALLSGVAGSGKSTLLSLARSEWEGAGYRVIGTAVNGTAAQNLEKTSGIKSDTLAKLLSDLKFWGNREDFRAPIEALARTHGPNILQPIEKLMDRFGPNIMQIVDPIVEKWGPNVLEPLDKLSENYTLVPLQKLSELNKSYGPNVLQAFHSLAHYVTENLPHFGKRPAPIDRKTVVVLDEAGNLDTRQGAELIKSCADHGAKLILAGGLGQLPAIGPGGVFEELIDRFPGSKLTENRRQKDPRLKEAVKDIHEGQPKPALREFQDRGALILADTRAAAKRALIDKWAADGRILDEKRILAGTNNDADELNAMAQEKRLRAKQIGGASIKHGSEQFHEGDAIAFHAPARKIGIRNGERGKIESINPRREQITVTLESGMKVTVSLEDYPQVGLGYASTSHAAQGGTYQLGYVLYDSSMQTKQLTYSQLSRFAEDVSIFATRAEAGDDLKEMRKQMARSEEKEMAHSISRSPDRPRGISR